MWSFTRQKSQSRRTLLVVVVRYANGNERAISTLYPGEVWHWVRVCSESNVPLDIWLAPVDENDPQPAMQRLTVEQYHALPAVLEARGQLAQARALLGLRAET